mgnify:CR=1 FL=1
MRVRYLLWLLSLSLLAQQKDIRFEQVGGGSLSGFTEDEKAEKAWEMNAKVMKPSEDSGKWDMQELSGQTFQSGKPSIKFTSPNEYFEQKNISFEVMVCGPNLNFMCKTQIHSIDEYP